MSKIGKNPIEIPAGITATLTENELKIKGPNGEATLPILKGLSVKLEEGKLIFSPEDKTKQTRSNWGTMRALTANAVKGAAQDFGRELIIEGVGYRAEVSDQVLILSLGYSHKINFPIPAGIKILVEKNTIKIAGADKERVGETAAKIRRFRKPEPYKGKGVRYSDEVVRRKAGKKAAGAGGK
ncbi:MAG TPA: 50S ribosomal protein L6 [Candidatus Tyrphobacter sp.]|nr:50S ribosomal protein L6 [Candidatus Tyrphobacter sp.]